MKKMNCILGNQTKDKNKQLTKEYKYPKTDLKIIAGVVYLYPNNTMWNSTDCNATCLGIIPTSFLCV